MNLNRFLNKSWKFVLWDKQLNRETYFSGKVTDIEDDGFWINDKFGKVIFISTDIYTIKRADPL